MSGFEVKVEQLRILPHPNADLLELAQVGLFRAVVGKGQFRDGDYALYVPEQAILPDGLIEELGLTGKLAGKEKNRVKAVRLRQELSQGIVCRPKALGIDWDGTAVMYERGGTVAVKTFERDYADALGIVKWVPPIPPQMAGEVESAPGLIRWIEIENVKRYPDIFEPGEMVEATEKIHGTCCLYTLNTETGEEWVSSKGIGAQSLAIKEDSRNLYWRAVRKHGLRTYAAFMAGYFRAGTIALFGEVYGKGVQDLHYGADAGSDTTLGYRLFDVAYLDGGERVWVEGAKLDELWRLAGPELLLSRAPLVYRGPYDYPLLEAFANVKESMLDSGTLREGIVVRPAVERYSPVLGGRAIAKFVSDAYLERKGAVTEFE